VIPDYVGAHRVASVVTVRSFSVPSEMQQAVSGGTWKLVAGVVLKDSGLGAELSRGDLAVAGPKGDGEVEVVADQAISRLEDGVMGNLAVAITRWLPTAPA
jgi:hypothetical protein